MFYRVDHATGYPELAKNLTRMLTRDMFGVAKLLVVCRHEMCF